MKKKEILKLFTIVFVGTVCFFILSLTLTLLDYEHTITVTSKEPVAFVIKPGESFKTVVQALHEQGIIKRSFLLKLLGRLQGKTRHIQAGEYALAPGTTVGKLLKQLNEGNVVQYAITLVEGWRFQQVVEALQRDPHISHTVLPASPAEIMIHLGQGSLHPEGRFFPSTYFFVKGTSDKALLLKAFITMDHELHKAWEQRDPTVTYANPYEALIVASIIEKEAGVKEEQPLVAGVILHRLRKHMPLQVDAAVIYGLGHSFHGDLTKAHLHKSTPYNTYLYRGLPPTPIAMPSENALYAALHPQGNALYYVSKGDGTHLFSQDLKHHNRAVQCYQRKVHWPDCVTGENR